MPLPGLVNKDSFPFYTWCLVRCLTPCSSGTCHFWAEPVEMLQSACSVPLLLGWLHGLICVTGASIISDVWVRAFLSARIAARSPALAPCPCASAFIAMDSATRGAGGEAIWNIWGIFPLSALLWLYQEREAGDEQDHPAILFLWPWCACCCVSSRPSSSISSQAPVKSNPASPPTNRSLPQSVCCQLSVPEIVIHQPAAGLLLIMGGKIAIGLCRHCYCP